MNKKQASVHLCEIVVKFKQTSILLTHKYILMTSFEHRKHSVDFAEEGTSGNSGFTKINRNFTTDSRTLPRKNKYQTF